MPATQLFHPEHATPRPARSSPARWRFKKACAGLLALAAGWAPGEARGEPAGDVASTVAALPRDVDLIVVVSGLASTRDSGPGRVAARVLAAALGAEGTPASWRAFAAAQGWGEAEAVDRLVGSRVVFLARGLGEPGRRGAEALPGAPGRAGPQTHAGLRGFGEPVWVMTSAVSSETGRNLVERLQAAPRVIVRGHRVLSVEGGRYELTSHGGAAARAGAAAPTTLIFGPAAKPGLFDEMITVTADAGAPVGVSMVGTPALRAVERMGAPDVLVLSRLRHREDGAGGRGGAGGPAEAPGAATGWEDFLAVACTHDDTGWTAKIVLRDREPAAAFAHVPTTEPGALAALAEGSIAAVIETVPEGLAVGAGTLAGPLTAVAAPPGAAALLTGRQALVVRGVEGTPGVGVGLAMGVKDRRALAPLGDAHLARLAEPLQGQPPADGPGPERNGTRGAADGNAGVWAGLAVSTIRVLPLRVPALLRQNPLGLDGLTLAWAYPPGAKGEGENEGWWVISVTPRVEGEDGSAASIVAGMAESLARGEVGGEGRGERGGGQKGERAAWVSRGEVRPGAAADAVQFPAGDGEGSKAWRSLARSIQRVEWGMKAVEGGIDGTVTVETMEK